MAVVAAPADGDVDVAEESLRDVPLGVWFFLAAFVFNIFAGHSDALGLPISPDRLLFPAAFLLAVLDPRRPSLRPTGLHLAMAVLVLGAALSLTFHGGIGDSVSLFGLLDRMIMPFLLFLLAPVLVHTATRRLLFLGTLTLVGAYVGVTMIAETVGADALLFPRYIAEIKAAAHAGQQMHRAGGPFAHGEAGGMAVAMCGAAALALAVRDRRLRVPAGAVALVCLVATVGSLTRSVWLGTILAIAVVFLRRRELRRHLPLLAVGTVIMLLVGAAAFPEVTENVVDRLTTSRSLYDRENTNAAAFRAIGALPFTGVGWGQFLTHGTEWVRQADTYPLTTVDIEIHNVFLSRTAELGIPLGLLYVAIVLLGPVRSVLTTPAGHELWRWVSLAALVIWFVPAMTSPIPYPFPTFVLWAMTGVLAAAHRAEHDVRPVIGRAAHRADAVAPTQGRP